MRRVAAPLSRVLVTVDPRHFYIGLAVVLAAWTVATTLFDRQHRLKTSTYDWMLNHQLRNTGDRRPLVRQRLRPALSPRG